MSLSDKIYGFGINRRKVKKGFIWEEDVKQFIKDLQEHKEKIHSDREFSSLNASYIQGRLDAIGIFNDKIEKLAGEKLI